MLQRHWHNPCRGTGSQKSWGLQGSFQPKPLPWIKDSRLLRIIPGIFWVSQAGDTTTSRQPAQCLTNGHETENHPDTSRLLQPWSPTPEGKSLTSSKTLQAVCYKGLHSPNSRRFPFPDNREYSLVGGNQTTPNPQINRRAIAQGTFLLFFPWIS